MPEGPDSHRPLFGAPLLRGRSRRGRPADAACVPRPPGPFAVRQKILRCGHGRRAARSAEARGIAKFGVMRARSDRPAGPPTGHRQGMLHCEAQVPCKRASHPRPGLAGPAYTSAKGALSADPDGADHPPVPGLPELPPRPGAVPGRGRGRGPGGGGRRFPRRRPPRLGRSGDETGQDAECDAADKASAAHDHRSLRPAPAIPGSRDGLGRLDSGRGHRPGGTSRASAGGLAGAGCPTASPVRVNAAPASTGPAPLRRAATAQQVAREVPARARSARRIVSSAREI